MTIGDNSIISMASLNANSVSQEATVVTFQKDQTCFIFLGLLPTIPDVAIKCLAPDLKISRY